MVYMDKMIEQINNYSSYTNLTAKYSSPEEYFKEVYKDQKLLNIEFNETEEDFFPYKDQPDKYWVGYFESRSRFKNICR